MQLREIKSLKKLHHGNIIRLKEVIRENEELFFVFEYMEGNLYQLMESWKNSGKFLGEQNVLCIVYQIMQGLAYVHNNGFFHRDMKPENILVSQQLDINSDDDSIRNSLFKIADFGLAREIRSVPPYTDYVATRWYRAPELLLRSTNYSSPVDIWAMGAIAFELYTLRPMFCGQSEIDQLFKICSIMGSPLGGPDGEEWKDGLALANKLGFKFPHCVPVSMAKIMPEASPNGQTLVQDMLKWDPSKRPSASTILSHSLFKNIIIPDLATTNLMTSATGQNNRRSSWLKDDVAFNDPAAAKVSAVPSIQNTTWQTQNSLMNNNNNISNYGYVPQPVQQNNISPPIIQKPLMPQMDMLFQKLNSNPASPVIKKKDLEFIPPSSEQLETSHESVPPYLQGRPSKKSINNIYHALNADLLKANNAQRSDNIYANQMTKADQPKFLQHTVKQDLAKSQQQKTVYDDDLSDILKIVGDKKVSAQHHQQSSPKYVPSSHVDIPDFLKPSATSSPRLPPPDSIRRPAFLDTTLTTNSTPPPPFNAKNQTGNNSVNSTAQKQSSLPSWLISSNK